MLAREAWWAIRLLSREAGLGSLQSAFEDGVYVVLNVGARRISVSDLRHEVRASRSHRKSQLPVRSMVMPIPTPNFQSSVQGWRLDIGASFTCMPDTPSQW